MKAILGLFLLLLVSACENQKQEARPKEYRQQDTVEAASSGLAAARQAFHLTASTAHSEWMKLETVKDELKREQKEHETLDNATLDQLRRTQREKRLADLNKEVEETTNAKADAEKAYSEQTQRIEDSLKSGRALLQADAKPQALKKLEEEIKAAEKNLSDVVKWKQTADDAANKYMGTVETQARMDAQRAYSKIAQEHWNLK